MSEEQAAQEQPAKGKPRDPRKGLRGIMAGTLVLEAIVVGLSLLVVAKLGDGLSTFGGILVAVLAVAMVVASGLMRFRWGVGLALGLQAVMIVSGLVVTTLGALGVLFGLVWAWLLWLRADLERRLAAAANQPPA